MISIAGVQSQELISISLNVLYEDECWNVLCPVGSIFPILILLSLLRNLIEDTLQESSISIGVWRGTKKMWVSALGDYQTLEHCFITDTWAGRAPNAFAAHAEGLATLRQNWVIHLLFYCWCISPGGRLLARAGLKLSKRTEGGTCKVSVSVIVFSVRNRHNFQVFQIEIMLTNGGRWAAMMQLSTTRSTSTEWPEERDWFRDWPLLFHIFEFLCWTCFKPLLSAKQV